MAYIYCKPKGQYQINVFPNLIFLFSNCCHKKRQEIKGRTLGICEQLFHISNCCDIELFYTLLLAVFRVVSCLGQGNCCTDNFGIRSPLENLNQKLLKHSQKIQILLSTFKVIARRMYGRAHMCAMIPRLAELFFLQFSSALFLFESSLYPLPVEFFRRLT